MEKESRKILLYFMYLGIYFMSHQFQNFHTNTFYEYDNFYPKKKTIFYIPDLMSIRSTVGSVLSRNRGSNLEAEREAIVQRLFITLHKACHKNDEPPKEKHVRTAICQTHEAQSAVLFWKLAAKLPLAVNAVTCWKFAYLVHKLLRDGHMSMIKDSRAYISRLEELAKYWSHIQARISRHAA